MVDSKTNVTILSTAHTQAIIGSIGDLDSPMSPDQKGFTSMVEFLQVGWCGGDGGRVCVCVDWGRGGGGTVQGCLGFGDMLTGWRGGWVR